MNILILNWRDPKNPKAGGAELVTLKHASAWVKAGHKVTWFTSEFPNAEKSERINGISVVRSGSSLSVYLFAPIFYLRNRKSFDIVIDEIHGIPFFTPLYVRKPKIAFIHEVAGEIWDYMYPFPINIFGKLLESFYFFFYKNILFWTDADSTNDELSKHGIPKKNCYAINCPPDVVPIDSLPKKELKPTFIFVSRLVKMKGIEDVLKAFSFIIKELPDAQLWIVGGGDEKYIKQLKKLVRDLDITRNTSFLGRVNENEKISYMRKAHLLLHASVKEGWGLVVVEAASQGTTAVVYNVAGLRDSVKDEKTGIVIDQNTPFALATSALKLIKNKKQYSELQKNALVWAKSLTWDNATKESLKIISSL